jgi:putative endonuclease
MRSYFVYIMASRERTLYVGVTNDLERRVVEHRSGMGGEFSHRYRTGRLVFYEEFQDIREAIASEKKLKGWSRAKKLSLIETQNPEWLELAP